MDPYFETTLGVSLVFAILIAALGIDAGIRYAKNEAEARCLEKYGNTLCVKP